MTTQRDEATGSEARRVGRRGILTVAAAAVAALATRHAADAQPVAAATTDTNFIATGAVDGTADFDARGTAQYGLDTFNGGFQAGVNGYGSIIGVHGVGRSTGSIGVRGIVNSRLGTAVFGGGGRGGTGVHAVSILDGFFIDTIPGSGSAGATGVFAVLADAQGTGANGVRAIARGTGTYGVLATTGDAGSVACSGQATGTGSYGVYGTSTTSHGVYGVTAAPGAASVYGYTTASGAAAITGVAGAGAYAGSFQGAVVVNGDFVAYGGAKSAAVPHPDGSHRLVYCVEAAEPWLEDFGEGMLVGGKAEVKLDPDFAAVADTGKMHVFVTERGTHHHLTVSGRAAGGFTVEADAEGAAIKGKKMTDLNGAFSYRVVARRKDIKGERLPKFAVPKTETGVPPVPRVSALPAPPKRPDER